MIVKRDLDLKNYRLCRGQYLTDQSKLNGLEKSKKLLNDLKQALLKACYDIDDNYLRCTVDSVPDRLKACIKAKGFNFEHQLK
uniref:Uncharacterized protein n=1 Tax=Caenorhabditis japonica TaxID=281687 RepID=A0A8R1EDF8_CAEJA